MSYRMLVTDMDDTLLNNRSELSEEDREVILAAEEKGLKFVLASGRPTYGMRPVAEKLCLRDFDSFLLSYNGAHILSAKTGEVIRRKELAREDLHLLWDYAKQYRTDILTYKDEKIVSDHPGKYVRIDLELTKMPLLVPSDFKAHMDCGAPKCMLLAEPEDLNAVESVLKERHGDRFTITRSRPYFLEFVAKGVSKGAAVAWLAAEEGIAPGEIIACGDSWNDLDMIRYAGLGVAVANANEEARAQADYITASNDNGGVARVIRKFYLREA
ncbi:MAG: Cof-type HAD-IIB family hydrolase [Fusobacteriaceae bacterium]|nr:Cof-type HAD-IIB family hydrolase [Fusobacteriaceae bacterium]